jgi:hypothetical protein
MVAHVNSNLIKTILGVAAGLMGWMLLVWNPKSKKQNRLAWLMVIAIVLYLIFGP